MKLREKLYLCAEIQSNRIKAMTKADLVNQISRQLGVERTVVQRTIEACMAKISEALGDGESVYLRGFGSFIVKERAEKVARDISKSKQIVIPAHKIPAFKPSKMLVDRVKQSAKAQGTGEKGKE